MAYSITKWCKSITDSHQDVYTGKTEKTLKEFYKNAHGEYPQAVYKFRLLDDDGEIYCYGLSTNDSSFAPLDRYEPLYGVTEIQYKNPITGKYETL